MYRRSIGAMVEGDSVALFRHPDDLEVEFKVDKDGYYFVTVHIPSSNSTVVQGYRSIQIWMDVIRKQEGWRLINSEVGDTPLIAIELDYKLSSQHQIFSAEGEWD